MASTKLDSRNVHGPFRVQELPSFPQKDRRAIVERAKRIEKKSFPSSEAFDFDAELRKKNTNMIVAMIEGESQEVAGYLIYLRMKRLVLLHKICVVESMRSQGIGKSLMHSLLQALEKGGCQSIHLWVDEARGAARALYQSCGFEQIDRCEDYYGTGRHALKMQLAVEK